MRLIHIFNSKGINRCIDIIIALIGFLDSINFIYFNISKHIKGVCGEHEHPDVSGTREILLRNFPVAHVCLGALVLH